MNKDNVVCPKCGKRNIEILDVNGEWECYDCGIEFIVKIKEKSPSTITPLTEGSTRSNVKDVRVATSRPKSPPPAPTKRVILPAPRKSKLSLEQIQAAVRKVSKNIKDKL